MNYVGGNFAETHTHPHEQCGYVVSRKYRLRMEHDGKIDLILNSGDSYAFLEGNTSHSFECD